MRNRLLKGFSAAVVLGVCGLTGLMPGGGLRAQSVIVPQTSTGFLIGPVGGINLVGYNSSAFPILNQEKDCFTAQNGSDVAPWGGITAEFPLGDPNAQQNYIIGEVLYDSKSSKFTAQSGSSANIPTKQNGYEAMGSVQTSLNAQLSYLLFNLAYKYNFTPGPQPIGPGIQVGPSIGLRMTSKFNKTVTVTAASGQGDGLVNTATLTSPQDVDGAQSIRIALRAAVTYDVAFSPSWIATPTIGYDFPITKVDNTDRNWRAQSIFGGIAFRYYLKG